MSRKAARARLSNCEVGNDTVDEDWIIQLVELEVEGMRIRDDSNHHSVVRC